MSPIPSPTAVGLSLKSLLPAAMTIKADDLIVRSCAGDLEHCQTGDLYVAVVTADEDGHEHAQLAADRGAIGIVTERLLAVDIPQFIVEDSRQALAIICQALAGHPAGLLTTIGVAGSNGKTVTSELISHMIRVAGGEVAKATTLEKTKSFEHLKSSPATQNGTSAKIANWMVNAVLDHASHTVLEVNSQMLAEQQLHGTAFDVLVLTNIRRDESQFERLDETYQQVQARALEYLKPNGMAVINADDPNSQALLDTLQVPALTYGINQAAEVTAKLIERTPYDQTFVITAGHESIVVQTQMIGIQHIYNCLAAATVGLTLGFELSEIARGLETTGQIPGRLESIRTEQSFRVLVDAAQRSTPIATAIHAARQHLGGPLWVLASIDEKMSAAEARRIGEILDKAADLVVLAPTNTHSSANYEPFHQVLDGVSDQTKFRTMLNRFRSIEWLLDNIPDEGTVLILGNGERLYSSGLQSRELVNDRRVCETWLYERQSFATAIPESPAAIYNIADYRRSN